MPGQIAGDCWKRSRSGVRGLVCGTSRLSRLVCCCPLRKLVEGWLATFPDRDSAIAVLDRERVPCAPVLKLEEAMAHPHLRGRKTVRRVRDEALGEFEVPGMPVKFSDWPDRPRTLDPCP